MLLNQAIPMQGGKDVATGRNTPLSEGVGTRTIQNNVRAIQEGPIQWSLHLLRFYI